MPEDTAPDAAVFPPTANDADGWVTALITGTFPIGLCDAWENFEAPHWRDLLNFDQPTYDPKCVKYNGFNLLTSEEWRDIILVTHEYLLYSAAQGFINKITGTHWKDIVVKYPDDITYMVDEGYTPLFSRENWVAVIFAHKNHMFYYINYNTGTFIGTHWADLLIHDGDHRSAWQAQKAIPIMETADWARLIAFDDSYHYMMWNSNVYAEFTADDWVGTLLGEQRRFCECSANEGWDLLEPSHWIGLITKNAYFNQFAVDEDGFDKFLSTDWVTLILVSAQYESNLSDYNAWDMMTDEDWELVLAKYPHYVLYRN